jgi:hypothetical protein
MVFITGRGMKALSNNSRHLDRLKRLGRTGCDLRIDTVMLY